jgi:secondary thiamine-phosphate synthase enzyme
MRIKTIELFFDKPKEDFYIKNITDDVSKAIKESKIKEGIVNIFVSGSTASISTMEFEPNLVKDIEKAMERIAPSDIEYEHHKTWGDENGKSHVRATIVGPSLTVPFKDGKLLLGTWQQIVLLDFDVPKRERKVVVQIIGE